MDCCVLKNTSGTIRGLPPFTRSTMKLNHLLFAVHSVAAVLLAGQQIGQNPWSVQQRACCRGAKPKVECELQKQRKVKFRKRVLVPVLD
jgi:hypothetical protein